LDLKNKSIIDFLINSNKIETLFNKKNRIFEKFSINKISEKNIKKMSHVENFFFNDESFLNLKLLTTKNYLFLNINQNFESTCEMYDLKKLFNIFLNSNKLFYNNELFTLTTHPSATVLDSFRSDLDEFS
jgi:hypothetical protein